MTTTEITEQKPLTNPQDPTPAAPVKLKSKAIPISPQDLLEIACRLRVLGISNIEISRSLRRNHNTIDRLIASKEGKKRINELSHEIWGQDFVGRLKSMVPTAIDTEYSIMTDEDVKPGVRVQVAESIIDRTLGKATQHLEVHDVSMAKMIEKLDLLARKKQGAEVILDAEFSEVEKLIDEPSKEAEDEIDIWLKKNLK